MHSSPPPSSPKAETQQATSKKPTSLVVRFLCFGLALGISIAPVVTVCRFFSSHWFYCEIVTSLCIQWLILSTTCLAVSVVIRHWRLVGLHFFGTALLLAWTVPPRQEISLVERQDLQSKSIKILYQNVLRSNSQREAFFSWVKQESPDVIAVVELGRSWDRDIRAELGSEYVYQQVRPTDFHNFGLGVYSRLRLSDPVYDDFGTETVSLLVRLVDQDIAFVLTHPYPPGSQSALVERDNHLAGLANRIADEKGSHWVVVGDFNLTPYSPSFHQFCKTAGLRRIRQNWFPEPTWYASPSGRYPVGLVIDHSFVSESIDSVYKFEVGPDIGSDHRGLSIEVGLD